MKFPRFRCVIPLLLMTWMTGQRAALAQGDGRQVAILIGVNNYENAKLKGAGNLKYADGDARRLGDALAVSGFSRDGIVVMNTGEPRESPRYPTATNIRKQLKGIAGQLHEGDTMVVGFAGYEMQFADDDDYYLCSTDADLDDTHTLISLREVCSTVGRSKARNRLVIVDSCRGRERAGGAPTPRLADTGVGVLFACSAGQISDEDEKLRSGFVTYFLIEGLRGAADSDQDGTITTSELYAFARARVSGYTKNQQVPDFLGAIPLVEFKPARGGGEVNPGKELGSGEGPSLYVLSIGINDYPDKRLKLDCAAPDAQSLRKAFLTNSSKLFRGVEVKFLLNGQATRASLLEGLEWLSSSVKPGDMAVVFYAGHGDCKIEGQFYLVPVDANLRDLSHTAISGEALKKAIGELPCTTMLLLDACYAGSFDGTKRKKRSLPAESDAVLRQLVYDAGLVVMCGASKEQEAAEEDGHGFFTQSLVEGLQGKADYNKDGVVELYELQLYVHGRVRELSAQEQEPTVSIPSVVKSFALSRP